MAFNTPIEPARAGDQGRGFVVVAKEVRVLVNCTQQSMVEKQFMVEGLQAKSTNAVNSISWGHKVTQDSLSYSAEIVSALDKIGQSFQCFDNFTSQIAISTLAQKNTTSSINDSMMAVVSLSNKINHGLNSVAAHAEQQQQTSQEVEQTINRICV
ncbi:MAG: methyl-accepting chemotaxis protein [Colwellia sp.]